MPLNTVCFKIGDFSIAWETNSNVFNIRVHRAGLLVTYSGTYGLHQLPLSSWQSPEQGFTFHLANVPLKPLAPSSYLPLYLFLCLSRSHLCLVSQRMPITSQANPTEGKCLSARPSRSTLKAEVGPKASGSWSSRGEWEILQREKVPEAVSVDK